MNAGHLAYLIISIFMFMALSTLIVLLFKSKSIYKKVLLRPVFFAFAAIPFYCIFILTKNYSVALFFNTLYYVCTDWMAFYILFIALAITGRKMPLVLVKVSYIIPVADSISLMMNCFFNHTYDIVWSLWKGMIYYWHLDFYPLHYLHLGLCYIFVAATLSLLFHEMLHSPSIYRKRYFVVFVAYSIVIIVNMICYNLNLPLDVSVLLYATLSAFVCYYANYMIPKTLVAYSLRNFNHTIEDAIICFDINKQYLYSNPAAEKLFEKNGKIDVRRTEKYRTEILEKFGNVKEFVSDDEVFIVEDVEVHCSVEYRELKLNGMVIGSFLKFQDRTEELNQLFKEHYTATRDQLTGIYNREYFLEMCDKVIKAEPDVPRVMIASNIRDFKMINDLFGVRKGDEVICKEADMLKTLSNIKNVYGRICDDKFALMMRREDFVMDILLNAMKELAKMIHSSSFQIRVNMGLCEFDNAFESAAVLYDKAVLAMDSMSEEYQQIYAYYDESIMERILTEKTVIADFDKAISEGQFEVFFENTTTADGEIKGADSYFIWNHPERGILRPEFFVPILEKTGYIYRLDLYIWEKVISLLSEWEKKYDSNIKVSINVSEFDFYYLNVAEEIINLVHKYGVKPENLVVDISEKIVSERFLEAGNCIALLKGEKIFVALDDFGRSVSSLKMIEKLETDVIKVDMRMFREPSEWNRSYYILEFIQKIAEEIGTTTIATNISSEEMFNELKKLNFSLYQRSDINSRTSAKVFEKRIFKG